MALSPYTLNFTDPSDKTAIELDPHETDGPISATRSLDIELFGNGTTTWGEKIEENLMHMLENFSCPEITPGVPDPSYTYAPITPTKGQLWFNSTDEEMYVYDDIVWKQLLTTAAGGGVTTFTGPVNSTVTSGDLSLADSGHARQTLHDGGGNWNFRHNSYYDGGDLYGESGSGAASLTFTSDGENGKIIMRTAVIGANAGDPITWGSVLQLTTTGLTLDGNEVWHAGNDGVGSGLDAELLDGAPSTAYQLTLTGATSLIDTTNLDPNIVAVSDGAGKIESSTVTTTELDYLIGTTSSVQSQLTTLGTTINPPTISHLNNSGYNHSSMIIDGVLYTSAGNSGHYHAHTTGRGKRYTNALYGMRDGFEKVNIPHTSPVVSSATTGNNAYALLANGNLYTWGWNSRGTCGLGHTNEVGLPTLAQQDVVEVYTHGSSGGYSVSDVRLIIKKTDGYLYGCGYNYYGQLGIGSTALAVNTFTQMTLFGTNPKAVFNLGSSYGCLVVQKSDDNIVVCGYNAHGQLGIGNTTQTIDVPNIVTPNWGGGPGFLLKQATGGFGHYHNGASSAGHLVMLLDDGTTTVLRTSGYGAWSTLGNGSTASQDYPVIPFVGAGRISKIAAFGAGPGVVQCLKEDGTLYVWGYNHHGQLGDNTQTARSTPLDLFPGEVIQDIYCDGFSTHDRGYYASSFIKRADGHLWGTGWNRHGELGIGFTADTVKEYTRTLLPDDIDVVEMGRDSTIYWTGLYCVLTSDSEMYAWGYNGHRGVTADSSRNVRTPLQIRLPGNK